MIEFERLVAASGHFPPVKQKCDACTDGKIVGGEHPDPGMGTEYLDCPNCEGKGFNLRDMDAREEHYYMLHLINGLDRRMTYEL